MTKKAQSAAAIKKAAIGLLDNRATDNDGMLIKRDKSVTLLDIFGSEQKTVVAYYVSDLLAKGFNNQQIITAVNQKFDLDWNIRQVNIVKELLHKMWRSEMAHSMNDQIAREVATIDTQLKEAWEAWEFSKKGISLTRTRTETSNSKADMMAYDVTEVINEQNTTAGDVKFLQHINDLGKEKRKLLGLYAPEKKADGDVKTAVQFNIVGDGAGGEITSMMREIMQGAATPQPISAPQQPVEEAQYVPVSEDEKEATIDKLYKEIVGDDF